MSTTTNITAGLVKQLREMSHVGMMDCKKALVETDGDINAAFDLLRKSGQLKASKKEGRITGEGLVVCLTTPDFKTAVLLEINCETDFVARDAGFIEFANKAGQLALNHKVKEINELAALPYNSEQTVDQARQELIMKIGENISLRRVVVCSSSDAIGIYSHGGRIGSLVVLKGGNASVGKDLAMHVAASNPSVVSEDQLPQSLIDKEREISMAQVEASGKPAEIKAKMVEGKIRKFVEEVSLLSQSFVKNPDQKVADYLKQNQAEVISYVRFEVGEGIEKVVTDFAAEVMAQIKGSQ
jgi:elongation factor Ts